MVLYYLIFTSQSSKLVKFLVETCDMHAAATVTFMRFFPALKARYDYGLMIFILTFCMVSV
ncbi:hypothetical protein, partial [Salmonella sp. gx-f5]|uniref:hypothetical protein n=1 Tax=Salmonella sp. gx-f5 TaxID=2582605 RepID=UPI0034D42C8A